MWAGWNPQKRNSWSYEPFATKLGVVVHYHEPECFAWGLWIANCHQGQGHSAGLNPQGILSWQYRLNHNTVTSYCNENWCMIMTQNVLWKVWVPVFKVKVILWAEILKKWTLLPYYLQSWICEPFATKHSNTNSIVVHHSRSRAWVFCCNVRLLSSRVRVEVFSQGISSEQVTLQGVILATLRWQTLLPLEGLWCKMLQKRMCL